MNQLIWISCSLLLSFLPNALTLANNNPNYWKNHGAQSNGFSNGVFNPKYHQAKSSSSSSFGNSYNNKYNRRPRISSLNADSQAGTISQSQAGTVSQLQRFPSSANANHYQQQTLGYSRPSSYQGPGSRGFQTNMYPKNSPKNFRNRGRNKNSGNNYQGRNYYPVQKYPKNPKRKKPKGFNDQDNTSGFGGGGRGRGGWKPSGVGGDSFDFPQTPTTRRRGRKYDDDWNGNDEKVTFYPEYSPKPNQGREYSTKRPTYYPNSFYPNDPNNFPPNGFAPKDISLPPPPIVTTPNYYNGRPKDTKLEGRIAELRKQLESRERMLKEVQNEVDGFRIKSKNVIRALRKRRSYFYDGLMQKTIKYVSTYDENIEKQLKLIDEIKQELDSKSLRAYPWKLSYIEKKIRKNNLIKDADQLAIQTSAKISELNIIVDDMTREQKIRIPSYDYKSKPNYSIKPCLHPHHACLPHEGPHNDNTFDNYLPAST